MSESVLYMTVGNHDEAVQIGRALVEEKLVACVNIISGVTSVYHWQDAVHQDQEVVVIGKTASGLVAAATTRAAELHSYECPCITSWKLDDVHPPYAEWIRETTRGPA